jgi:asparagine synthetase B (glutamine-hydrolysing)
MCGIAGIMVKQESDLGESLFKMLYEIRHRGCDATGTALYLGQPRDFTVARVSMLNPAEELPLLRSIVSEHAELGECETYRCRHRRGPGPVWPPARVSRSPRPGPHPPGHREH